MQNRYVGDIGDFLKLGILRALSPGYRVGVAWWLYPDEGHNQNSRDTRYLDRPDQWWKLDPQLFDALEQIVASGQRDVQALETANLLPGAIFASEVIPVLGPIQKRLEMRHQWFQAVQRTLDAADLVFLDPDSGLEPESQRHRSSKVGKTVLLNELRALARPGCCLIVYHHPTHWKGGHHAEIEHLADRLRGCGFAIVDALRPKSRSSRVFFVLNASADIRQRARQIETKWEGWITWHPDRTMADSASLDALPPLIPMTPGRSRNQGTTQAGYINRNEQEVIRPTGKPGTAHRQLGYVLRCRACGYEYGANGSDIFHRRCPAHDGGGPGIEF